MIRRRLCLGAAAIALTVPLTGCVTVHGERALIPSTRPAEAAKVLADFVRQNNKAKRAYDEHTIASVESGPLGAIDQAAMRAKHANSPQGNPRAGALVLSGQKFFIPEQRGWPKFFVAEATSNVDGDTRWLLAFRRSAPDQPWKAGFLCLAAPDELPDFAVDKHGYAEPVPSAGTDLLAQPGQLSTLYAQYLDADQGASGTSVFADGTATSGLRAVRRNNQRTANTVTQYLDQGAVDGDFAPVALRTKDGGAAVFFGSRHQSRSTFRVGYRLDLDQETQALTIGTPRTSITLSQVAQEMVTVPPASRRGSAKVVFVSRLQGLVSAQGQ